MRNDDLGRNMRAKRKQMGLGLREAAARAGISASYWSTLESGTKRNPGLHKLEQIAKALETTVEALLKR